MSQAVIPVHMPEPLFHDAARQAQRAGISVEDWLISLAAESIRYEYVADRFFRHPANPDAGKVMLEVLEQFHNGCIGAFAFLSVIPGGNLLLGCRDRSTPAFQLL